MERIAVAGNIEPPIYQMILDKGYSINYENEFLIAQKGDLEIIANNMIELAGIISLRENKGRNWKVSDDVIDNFLNFIEQKNK